MRYCTRFISLIRSAACLIILIPIPRPNQIPNNKSSRKQTKKQQKIWPVPTKGHSGTETERARSADTSASGEIGSAHRLVRVCRHRHMLSLVMRARYQHPALQVAARATPSRGTRCELAASGFSSCGGGVTLAAVRPSASVPPGSGPDHPRRARPEPGFVGHSCAGT
jgi:hypothetical protein